ncbi:MAG: alpha/beta hydrolase [Candidatus Omnitrophica bacterium]|nr:alpha/beta hydrolase [Candidatus Omnitrophota bacterium]MBU2251455.1 alpha/beta hydrolase [Candidatus Omnitrophota bacterium]MBU2473922.1 alpha/beta hydrolase [Candidatus Omnitrophota bacterium]
MIRIVVYSLIVVLLMVGYVKYLESSNIFFPSKKIEYSPSSISLSFQDLYIQTEDNLKINGWFIPNPEAKYTLLFLHGNAGNIADRLDKLKLLYQVPVNIFIVDYRGYGRSQGKPSEIGLYLDAQAAYRYLVNSENIQPENIIVYGESLGGAVAMDLASAVKVKALISEGAFSSIRDMARVIYPWMPTFLLSVKFDSLAKINKIEEPKLFIHSRDDEVVPFNLGQKLYNAAREPKKFYQLSGGHNDAFLEVPEEYLAVIEQFINRLD